MSTRSSVLAPLTVSLVVGAATPIGGAHVKAIDGLSSLPPTATTAPSGSPSAIWMPGPDASGGYDACFLVSDSEMEGLFRRSLAMTPTGTRATDEHDCLWSFGPELEAAAAIWLGAYNGWADLAGLMPETVPGLGDEALWVLGGLLYVRTGDTAFTVMVISDTLDAKDTAILVARFALPRIGPRQTSFWDPLDGMRLLQDTVSWVLRSLALLSEDPDVWEPAWLRVALVSTVEAAAFRVDDPPNLPMVPVAAADIEPAARIWVHPFEWTEMWSATSISASGSTSTPTSR